ncbi:outer membrane beta-barrel protein [Methylocystis sp. MJC1]|jgi:outer membrane protein W|uniref:OmpW/AlkL family protein n=1 Tax=Methylocystis sp. MJC1 TaxID=2654282 RepID=UPI0013EBA554|nr:OmpW family outer membrane protein [Methylocystis sp. MJC1]KAF2991891.1 Outer membrane protein W [Methylocystis sp. MJC1]MBU6528994.1 OmpW family protein [Methylocystis sp. MJC1]UZX11874.1 outer membrane beta-barrel protein [Methylocystis sp. MJC1]
MRNIVRGAVAAIAMGTAAVSAHAADLPSIKAPPPPPVFVDTYQPFQIRLKVGSLIPLDGTAKIYDAGAVHPTLAALGVPGGSVGLATGLSAGYGSLVPGASTSISTSVIPMLDVAYYLTKNWAIEAICCVSPHHIQGTGVLAGSSLAHTWAFPPSVMLQYHFTNFGAFQPYLGVGVNFTTFWGTRAGNNNWALNFAPGSTATTLGAFGATASFYSASITPSWGVVGQAGADYMFNEHWGVNVDVKYIMVEPNAHANIVAFIPGPVGAALNPVFVPVNAAVKINPLVVSAGLTYRFGGDWGVPKLLPF